MPFYCAVFGRHSGVLAKRRFLGRRPAPWPTCIPQSERFTLSTFLNIAKGTQSETFTLWNAYRPRDWPPTEKPPFGQKSETVVKNLTLAGHFSIRRQKCPNPTAKNHTLNNQFSVTTKMPENAAENPTLRWFFCVTVARSRLAWPMRTPSQRRGTRLGPHCHDDNFGGGPHWVWRRSALTRGMGTSSRHGNKSDYNEFCTSRRQADSRCKKMTKEGAQLKQRRARDACQDQNRLARRLQAPS